MANIVPITEAPPAKPPKPGFKRPLAEIMTDLTRPIPSAYIKTKPKGGQKLKFVSWFFYVKLLNHYAPGWESESEITQVGGKTVSTLHLTIHAQEGSVTRTGVGIEDTDLETFGDPVSNANAQALRKACAMFGIALELWIK